MTLIAKLLHNPVDLFLSWAEVIVDTSVRDRVPNIKSAILHQLIGIR